MSFPRQSKRSPARARFWGAVQKAFGNGLRAVLLVLLFPPGVSAQTGLAPTFAEGFVAQSTLNAIGRVNVAGFKRRNHCTGVLIAPDRVLTAAHCLRRTGSDGAKRPVAVGDIHFLAGADRGGYLAHGRAACVRFSPGGEGLASDAAIIHLIEPIEIAPLAIRVAAPPTIGAETSLHGYPRRRAHALTSQNACAIVERTSTLLLLDCPSEPGLSGGPVLTRKAEGGLEIAAMAVAATPEGRTLALPASLWRSLAQAACEPD